MNEMENPTESLDWAQIGENVRLMRQLLRLTQADLALQAKVDRSSIHRVERGRRVRLGTLQRICQGMNADFEEIRVMDRSYGPSDRQSCVIHRPEEAIWYPHEDARTRVPEDNEQRVQDPRERMRLGQLGFVPRFRSYLRFVMMDGPGVFFFEVFGRFNDSLETGEGGVYKDWILYCLRGRVRFLAGKETTELSEGSAVGFRSGFEFSLEAASLSPEDLPPLVMFIGANRRS